MKMQKNASLPPAKNRFGMNQSTSNVLKLYNSDFGTPLSSIRERGQISDKAFVQGGLDKINNLSLLISPSKNGDSLQMISAAFAQKRNSTKETWMQRVKKGSNFSADPQLHKDIMQKAKGENGLTNALTKDSSMGSFTRNLNFNPSNATLALTQLSQDVSMRNIPSPMAMNRSLMTQQPGGPIKAHSLKKRNKSIAGTPQPEQHINFSLPEINDGERKKMYGKNFDRIYVQKNEELESLIGQCKTFKTENNQLKKLNEKLVDRIDYLQGFIDKEAAASDFLYDYPPKAMGANAEEENLQKGSKQTAAASETQKAKKQFDDLMNQTTKNFEVQIKHIRTSMTDEIELLTGLLSKASRDLITLTIDHRKLEVKFNQYYQKSEQYMKQREETVKQLEIDLKQTQENYESFDIRFKKKDAECKTYMTENVRVLGKFESLEKISEKQAKRLEMFESKYQGIEISKLHEQIQQSSTKMIHAQMKEKDTLNQLFKLRDVMNLIMRKYNVLKETEIKKMTDKPKSYSGPALEFTDIDAGQKIAKREKVAQNLVDWKGDEDIEAIATNFLSFMFTTAKTTQAHIALEKRVLLKQLQGEAQKKVDLKVKEQEEAEERRALKIIQKAKIAEEAKLAAQEPAQGTPKK